MPKYITEQDVNKKSKLANWLWFFAILIVLYVAFYSVLNFVPYFKDRQQFVIVSDSMSPVINRGDLAIINKNFVVEDLATDDIVAFYQGLNNDEVDEVVVHYIAEITTDEFDNIVIKTRRHNATSYVDWDSWELTEDDIIGVFDYKISRVGSLLMFIESPFGKLVIIIDFIVILWVIEYFKKEAKPK